MAVGVVGAAVMAIRHAVAVTVPAAGCVAPAATLLRPHGLAVHIAGTRLDPVAGHPGMAVALRALDAKVATRECRS